jgi:hypothetical protein
VKDSRERGDNEPKIERTNVNTNGFFQKIISKNLDFFWPSSRPHQQLSIRTNLTHYLNEQNQRRLIFELMKKENEQKREVIYSTGKEANT